MEAVMRNPLMAKKMISPGNMLKTLTMAESGAESQCVECPKMMLRAAQTRNQSMQLA